MNPISWCLATALLASLAGCAGTATQPYVEPSSATPSARVRVISNASVFGDSVSGHCTPAVRHTMVRAGRFSAGQALADYPQFPLAPPSLGMPQRLAPPLRSLTPTVRMSEGRIEEVVAEYRVPTAVPFQFATLGAGNGTPLGRGVYCEDEARAYTLEPGRDYEVTIGMGSVGQGADTRMACRFDVRQLLKVGQGQNQVLMPVPVPGRAVPDRGCD